MNVKRYLGDTLTECMDQVRQELGVDAFILTERTFRKKGLKGLFSKPMVEVVAAYEPEKPAESERPAPRYTLAEKPVLPLVRDSQRYSSPPPRQSAATAPRFGHNQEDLSQEEAQAAAMSVFERMARQQSSEALLQSLENHPATPSSSVISAYGPQAAAQRAPAHESARSGESFQPLQMKRVAVEDKPVAPESDEKIKSLESKLDALSTTLNTLVSKVAISKDSLRGGYPAEVEALLLNLLENDVHEEFAHKLAKEAAEIIHKQEAPAREVMEQLVRQAIGEPSPLKLKKFKRSVVILLGPTGVGKTTTLAKLAAIFQLNHHAKVGVITTDTYRIAAVEQLKTYAEILDIPLSIVYSPSDISEALREHEDKDVVLVDTAGRSPNDQSLETEVTELIRHSDCDEVHLVVSATTGFTGLLNILNTYSFLRDYKILFTKLDETPSWGVLLNTKFLTDKPISYLAVGQNVPDDIEVMTPRKITDRLLGPEKVIS